MKLSRSPTKPVWQRVVRAQRLSPDLYYANEFAEQLRARHREQYDLLFG
jgi:hypothetical protein